MKLSDYKGEKAVEVFADLLEPVAKIFGDKEIADMVRANEPKLKIIQKALKNHAKEVIQAMAILDDVPVEGYNPSFMEIPARLLEMLNDSKMEELFTSQSQTADKTSSGSATVSTGASENLDA